MKHALVLYKIISIALLIEIFKKTPFYIYWHNVLIMLFFSLVCSKLHQLNSCKKLLLLFSINLAIIILILIMHDYLITHEGDEVWYGSLNTTIGVSSGFW